MKRLSELSLTQCMAERLLLFSPRGTITRPTIVLMMGLWVFLISVVQNHNNCEYSSDVEFFMIDRSKIGFDKTTEKSITKPLSLFNRTHFTGHPRSRGHQDLEVGPRSPGVASVRRGGRPRGAAVGGRVAAGAAGRLHPV